MTNKPSEAKNYNSGQNADVMLKAIESSCKSLKAQSPSTRYLVSDANLFQCHIVTLNIYITICSTMLPFNSSYGTAAISRSHKNQTH